MIAKFDLFYRPTIGEQVIACALDVKRIGSIEYVSFVDEHGFRAMTPIAGLTKKPVAKTVGENKREMSACAFALGL